MDTLRKLFRRKTKIQEASDDVLRKKIRELQFIASRCPGKFNKIARGTLQPENEMARQEAHLTLFIINLNEVSRVYLSGLSKKELRGLYMRGG